MAEVGCCMLRVALRVYVAYRAYLSLQVSAANMYADVARGVSKEASTDIAAFLDQGEERYSSFLANRAQYLVAQAWGLSGRMKRLVSGRGLELFCYGSWRLWKLLAVR